MNKKQTTWNNKNGKMFGLGRQKCFPKLEITFVKNCKNQNFG